MGVMTAPDVLAGFTRVPVDAPGQVTGPKELTCLQCTLLAIPWDIPSWSSYGEVNEQDVERPKLLGGTERWACLLCRRLFLVEWRVSG